ncbi:MAG TPA: hydroxypyruvate isomerase, partial [Gammaproteobacteria bacterium]|nr:hydroxypyruvate isomerase [Gammaproteobacteria bacterium]
MPRFAANLTTMFTELEPKDRFLAAYNAGFDAVEYLAPYGHDISELRSLLQDAQLSMILLNTGIGDGQKGERGLA